MIQLNLAKVLLLGDERTGYIRYEIYAKEGEDPAYPERSLFIVRPILALGVSVAGSELTS